MHVRGVSSIFVMGFSPVINYGINATGVHAEFEEMYLTVYVHQIKCAKHPQHAKHAYSGGMPSGNF